MNHFVGEAGCPPGFSFLTGGIRASGQKTLHGPCCSRGGAMQTTCSVALTLLM